MCRRGGRALRRLRRQVHGRRRAGLFRLSGSARGRRCQRGARRAGTGRGDRRARRSARAATRCASASPPGWSSSASWSAAGEAQERNVVGETPNLAARLQSAAAPNTVLIAAAHAPPHRRSVRIRSGRSGSAQGLRRAGRRLASSARTAACRAASKRCARPIRCRWSGRDEELDLLSRRWAQAKDGEGRVVLLSGEPGIGKSRLIAALLERSRFRRRTSACVTSACRTSRAARCSRSWRNSRTPPASIATTRRRSSAPSSRSFSGSRRHAAPSPICSALATSAESAADPQRKRAQVLAALLDAACAARGAWPGADGVRGCAVERSDLARAVHAHGRAPARAADPSDHHAPSRFPAALGRPCRMSPA